MTQEEQKELRLKCLNRRYRILLLQIALPILLLQPLCSPLYYYLVLLHNAEPTAPFTVLYADCSWASGHGIQNHLLLKTKGGQQYDLTEKAGLLLWEDVKSRQIVPGDPLQITVYFWPGRDRIATLSTEERIYSSREDYETSRLREIRIRQTGCMLVLLGGILCSGILFAVERKQLVEVRRMRKECR